ncbi:type II toxin-antitoxin system HicA family toxin [Nitrosovibrio sp. Nv4]|uniref:type II toxin-antitoxin system HicA family toxin n=1 Tax=Nitrosovibrio sp. Nv4 TaxID=1945880 RepID=UPI000BCB8B99|nr:Predicted RNA binding protein YcfA, dsRBD-like fold, HicA-like mRNA interferase family [Nitrosovibrio sp. Nv4]
MNGFYSSVIEQLKKHGFYYDRQGKGSHEIWSNGSIEVTVPFNCKSRFTANGIMKTTRIKHHF